MIIENLKPFEGQHCETTATGTLLNQIEINYSEPMLFGLGQGLGFIFWNMKSMSFPFIGGRVKQDELTENCAKNLGLKLNKVETASAKKAWDSVTEIIDKGQVVGLKLDCYYLDYFTNPIHFAGHYVALYGYDENYAYLIDTQAQGGRVKTSLESLALARAEKGPMSSRNLFYTLERTKKETPLPDAIRNAIKQNAHDFCTPPISNIGYKGIEKTSNEIVKWFDTSKDVKGDFTTTAMLMEKAGTGGALFRNLYRDFLFESYQLLNLKPIKQAYDEYCEIASMWTKVATLFESAGQTLDRTYILEASSILKALSKKEKDAMDLVSWI